MKRIENPPTPYLGHIVGNFIEGKTITIEGVVQPPAQSITINFQTGKYAPDRDDIALQLWAKLLEGSITRNSSIEGIWGKAETAGHYPLTVGKRFTISVTNKRPVYIIKINNNEFQFKQRLPGSRVNHISIQGNVKLYTICYETNMSYGEYVPLYDDPPPPYAEFAPKPRNQPNQSSGDDQCMFQTALPLALGTGIGVLGASLFGNRSKCQSKACGISCHCEKCQCRKCKPPTPTMQQTTSTSWGNVLGVGAAAVGGLLAIGGIAYALSGSSNNNDDDDDD
nr:galectin-9-like [Onthophagus taurus]